MNRGRVVVAMSGGVDSAVAALLLRQEGYQVIGVTLRLWGDEGDGRAPSARGCCSLEDVEDARRVCQILGVPHYVLNLQREFKAWVIDSFRRDYARGQTPHPCLACNDKIKFHFLLQRALFLEADHIATGHYARLRQDGGPWRLLKGVDSAKDQSYVLYTLTQGQMARLLLPIGWYRKTRIREMARDAGLPVADKPDSQDICFIPQGDYRAFLRLHEGLDEGEMVDTRGRVVGTHPGIQFFTVGQRRGLGISSPTSLYVVWIDAQSRQVVVGSERELLSDGFWASDVRFLAGEPPAGPVETTVKIRSRAAEAPATVHPRGPWVAVSLQEPQRAVAPGQAVVFYQGEEVLGGGTIEGPLAGQGPDPHLPMRLPG